MIAVNPVIAAAESKKRRVAAILVTQGRGLPRTVIQQVVEFAELVVAPKLAEIYQVSLELAVMGLYARNKTYRECKDAEVAIQNIEDEP